MTDSCSTVMVLSSKSMANSKKFLTIISFKVGPLFESSTLFIVKIHSTPYKLNFSQNNRSYPGSMQCTYDVVLERKIQALWLPIARLHSFSLPYV